jgi:hypothetical protein
MSISWEEVKESRETLLKLLKKYGGQRPLSRKIGVDHKSIKYWMDKYEITVSDYDNGSTSIKEGREEMGPKVEDFGEYYLINTPDGKYIKFTKEEEEVFRELYCATDPANRLTLRGCSEELEIERDDLYYIKTALKITHDDIEFTDEQLENLEDEDMVEISKQRRRKNLKRKIREETYKEALRENKKLRKKEYFSNQATEKILDKVDSFDWKKPGVFNVLSDTSNELTLAVNLTDWHFGKLVLGENLLGNIEGFNKNIFQKRIDKYLENIISEIDNNKIEEVVVLNYGDGLDDPNGHVYPGQGDHQDVKYEDQFMGYIDALQYFMLSIYDYMPYMRYSAVKGNHSKDGVNWDLTANYTLKKLLENYESIEMDVSNKADKIVNIYDSSIMQTHGNNIRNGKYTGQLDVLNMMRLADAPGEKVYVVQGHLHHQEQLEGVGHKWYKLPSLVGGDILSNQMMKVGSRPAQTSFLVSREGIVSEKYTYFD